MRIPTIHLNGTARCDLFAGYADAVAALNEACRCLARTCPNGRDYYPQGPQAQSEALNEHCARMAKLSSVIEELEAIAMAIDRE